MSREIHVRFWESARVKSPRATHLPLYRQHQRLGLCGVQLSRAILTQWVHRAAMLLVPIAAAQLRHILGSKTLAMDDKFAWSEFGPL